MSWTPDYCLTCDCQTAGGAYCSQACRLADLESGSVSTQSTNAVGALASGPASTSYSRGGLGLYLPPAVDFEAYINRLTASSKSTLPGSRTRLRSRTGAVPAASQVGSRSNMSGKPKLGLTPSSSGSSLSSLQSTGTKENGYVSDEARTQLRAYANAFDAVRDSKRKTTV